MNKILTVKFVKYVCILYKDGTAIHAPAEILQKLLSPGLDNAVALEACRLEPGARHEYIHADSEILHAECALVDVPNLDMYLFPTP